MNLKRTLLACLACICLLSFTQPTDSTKYKCMVQLVNYSGQGAYVAISLINPKGAYEKTLFVQGDDEEWYHDLEEWWHFLGKKDSDIDAISGATVGGGERAIHMIEIDDSKINAGYSIRFESAVEDKEYYQKDVEFLLTTENIKKKHEGKGYIRYIRMIPNKK